MRGPPDGGEACGLPLCAARKREALGLPSILFTLLLLASPAFADSVTVTVNARAIASFSMFGGDGHGALEFRGGLALTSGDSRFGGLSGLAISQDGASLLAVSDAGHWFKAGLAYNRAGRLAGISAAELAPMLDDKGKAPRGKWRNDAEALALLPDGAALVAFESQVKVVRYDLGARGFAARFTRIPHPKLMAAGLPNREVESIGRFSSGPRKGSLIAFAEDNRAGGGENLGWIFGGRENFSFRLQRLADYRVTDLAILPGGDVLVLERSYVSGGLPGMAIRRFSAGDIAPQALIVPELLFEGRAPFHKIDNMEGIAVSQSGSETRVTVVSDDNFDRGLQQTLLLQFALVR